MHPITMQYSKIGLDLDPTHATWSDMVLVVRRAEALGYDSLWTWDHLYGTDDPSQRIFEGWNTIGAWAVMTSRPTIGLLVGANTFRNPGLVAKSAVTVDHISGGRCILGLGAGWRPREHHDHGIAFGGGPHTSGSQLAQRRDRRGTHTIGAANLDRRNRPGRCRDP